MVSCAPSRDNVGAMHLVIMAWLFVIGTMSLTMSSVLAGLAFFAGAGVAPVALYAWLKLRRPARAQCCSSAWTAAMTAMPAAISSDCFAVSSGSGRRCRLGIRSATAT